MTAQAQPDNLQRPWLIAGGVIVAVVVALFDTFADMYRLWVSIDQFNHCLLIAPATLWMIWRKRGELALINTRVSPVGCTLFILTACCWALGTLSSIAFVQHVAAVALMPLAIWALLGTQVLRTILFPLAYLFFLVPFGGAMIPVLMGFTADMTVAAVRLFGIPVYHDGLYLAIPNGSFRIIEACSGIRMLFAGVAVGALFAYLNFRSRWRQVIFMLGVIALTILANWVRAIAIVIAAHLSGMEFVADHLWVGYAIFALVIVIMLWVGGRYSDLGPEDSAAIDTVAQTNRTPTRIGTTIAAAITLIVILLSMPILAGNGIERAGQQMTEPVVSLPASDSEKDWTGPAPYDGIWMPEFIGDTNTAAARYRGPAGQVDMIVISYQSLSASSELINETNRLYAADRWVLISQRQGVNSAANGTPINYTQTRLRSNNGNHLVFRHWYVVDGRPHYSPITIKLIELKNTLAGRPTPEGAVFIATRTGEDSSVADAVLDDFMVKMIR